MQQAIFFFIGLRKYPSLSKLSEYWSAREKMASICFAERLFVSMSERPKLAIGRNIKLRRSLGQELKF